ncbi:LuxR family transcriptional regulator [Anopheles sinensis]|uniref:LuxR family transcriptional regulator n=1 Tax=Anopheles sinensis TaxID=74873 RepID=A0A084WLF0_ANOSI|nr:LuxR family transcriptional regulator [Anopheles sinensis]
MFHTIRVRRLLSNGHQSSAPLVSFRSGIPFPPGPSGRKANVRLPGSVSFFDFGRLLTPAGLGRNPTQWA